MYIQGIIMRVSIVENVRPNIIENPSPAQNGSDSASGNKSITVVIVVSSIGSSLEAAASSTDWKKLIPLARFSFILYIRTIT